MPNLERPLNKREELFQASKAIFGDLFAIRDRVLVACQLQPDLIDAIIFSLCRMMLPTLRLEERHDTTNSLRSLIAKAIIEIKETDLPKSLQDEPRELAFWNVANAWMDLLIFSGPTLPREQLAILVMELGEYVDKVDHASLDDLEAAAARLHKKLVYLRR